MYHCNWNSNNNHYWNPFQLTLLRNEIVFLLMKQKGEKKTENILNQLTSAEIEWLAKLKHPSRISCKLCMQERKISNKGKETLRFLILLFVIFFTRHYSPRKFIYGGRGATDNEKVNYNVQHFTSLLLVSKHKNKTF